MRVVPLNIAQCTQYHTTTDQLLEHLPQLTIGLILKGVVINQSHDGHMTSTLKTSGFLAILSRAM